MTPERWKKIEDIFQSALDRETNERKEFICAECGGDDDLRSEVEKLVARFEKEEAFLESPVWTDSLILGNTLKSRVASSLEEEILPAPAENSFAGKKIGVYRLTEQIGRGGMGVVYAAERDDGEFRQRVAVKLIKRGMDTDFIVRRFRHERQILASLNHPNIARLFDGGTTGDDLPYFIMEFIEGVPFLKYCERKNLDLREKLRLFLQVCAPVIYAHNHKIIHRDLKPSNILITDEGTPKLLDFGIAKLLDTDSIHESLMPTATAMRLMTPEYASPEQVRGELLTPASDQYSLGVLLYELLTGERPYKFPSRSPHEIARVICEQVPSEPSSGSFGKAVTGDFDFKFDADSCRRLDRIVLKSLRKDPSERYASTGDFAADIERFLRHEEVSAEAFAAEQALPVGENPSPPIAAPVTGVSPRRRGVKQGVFITVLSIVLIPFFLILILAAVIPPPLTALAFLALLFGGLIRILYALILEPGKAEMLSSGENGHIRVAETGLIGSAAELTRATAAGKLAAAEKTKENEKSIAVLPFKNLNSFSGETAGSEFLSVGLADALITRISNVPQIIVRPTSSVLKFGAAETDSLEAGRELDVGFVVEGSIVRGENRIRVSVQLLDVENRSAVWAERFDEDSIDYLDLEDSIVSKVVESLVPRLTGEQRRRLEKRGTENAEAFESYLRGRFYLNSFTEDSFARAFASFNEAIALDDNYALAYAGIADYYIWLGVYGVAAPRQCYPPAIKAARRAIELDSELAEAYAALGFAQLCGDFDWENAERNALRAIEINPHYPLAHLWYSFVLQTAGRFDEGIEQAKEAVRLDPLTYINHHVLSWAYYFARRFDEAVGQAEKTIKKFPLVGLGEFTLSWILRDRGQMADAVAASERAIEMSGGSLFVLLGHAQALAAAGRRADTESALREIFEQADRQYLSFYQVALVYAYLDETEKALDALERAFTDREGWLIWLGTEPALDRLRGAERFRNLLEKINHPLGAEKNFQSRSGEPKLSAATEAANAFAAAQPRRRFPAALKYLAGATVILFLGLAAYNIVSHTTVDFSSGDLPPGEVWKNNFTSTMNIRRLTAAGVARKAVVSPDGKQVAYVASEDQNQSLRIRAADSENDRELVAPAAALFLEMKFSPDGRHIYYLVNLAGEPRTLYRIRVDGGGAPEKISEDVFYSFAFSPDGRRIAYDYANRATKKYNILTADIADAGRPENPRLVTELAFPDYFIGSFSFSPDGRKLMYGVSNIEESREMMDLFVYDFDAAAGRQLTTRSFSDIAGGAWRRGEQEIVICAAEDNSSLYQLWLVAYPSGEVTRLTNDFYDYYGVSLTGDSSALVTIKKDSASDLWVGRMNESSRDFRAEQITKKTSRQDGIEGINWTADGRILYVSSVNGENDIATINDDGSGESNFPADPTKPAHPALTADGRYLVFADERQQKMSIWRFDTQTGQSAEISSRYAVTPSLSADGRSVYYSTFSRSNGRMSLHRKPLAGGEETEITSKMTVGPVASPDGKFVACFISGEETENNYQIAVFPVETEEAGGREPRVIKVFQNGNLENPQSRPLAWSPDGKYLYFVNHLNNVANIFRIGVEGDAKPVQVTHFTAGKIFDFALAPDGRRVAFSRGTTTADIVIFKSPR